MSLLKVREKFIRNSILKTSSKITNYLTDRAECHWILLISLKEIRKTTPSVSNLRNNNRKKLVSSSRKKYNGQQRQNWSIQMSKSIIDPKLSLHIQANMVWSKIISLNQNCKKNITISNTARAFLSSTETTNCSMRRDWKRSSDQSSRKRKWNSVRALWTIFRVRTFKTTEEKVSTSKTSFMIFAKISYLAIRITKILWCM